MTWVEKTARRSFIQSELLVQLLDGYRDTSTGTNLLQGLEEAPSGFRRTEKVSRLLKTNQFVEADKRHIGTASTFDDERLTALSDFVAVHLQVSAGIGVSRHSGHRVYCTIYRTTSQSGDGLKHYRGLFSVYRDNSIILSSSWSGGYPGKLLRTSFFAKRRIM